MCSIASQLPALHPKSDHFPLHAKKLQQYLDESKAILRRKRLLVLFSFYERAATVPTPPTALDVMRRLTSSMKRAPRDRLWLVITITRLEGRSCVELSGLSGILNNLPEVVEGCVLV